MEPTEGPSAPTRNTRRRERTRRSLLDTGRTLIAERGVAGLRIQEITERAHVALGSFYNHFASKDELVEAVLSESLSQLAAASLRARDADTDPAVIVTDAVTRFMRLTQTDPEFAQLLVNLSQAETLFAGAVHPHAHLAVERGCASGRFSTVDIDVTVTAVMGGALALIREILEGHKTPDIDRAFSLHVLTALGLRPAEAADVWNRATRV